jgi:hypothetical protein
MPGVESGMTALGAGDVAGDRVVNELHSLVSEIVDIELRCKFIDFLVKTRLLEEILDQRRALSSLTGGGLTGC